MRVFGQRLGARIKIVMAVAGLLAVGSAPTRAADATFYQIEAGDLAGKPGTLIRAEAIAPPPGASAAYLVLYRSTGLHGEPVAVSGVVAIPPGAPASGGRGIVSWAHGTTGVARHCAPSLSGAPFHGIPGLAELLSQGFVVAATDYPGLGTPSHHPYLVARSAGHAVIDAARAARQIEDAAAGSHYVVWGYSQGGHAALSAGMFAKAYAPDMKLLGIAAVAPPTELGALLRADVETPVGKVLSTYALWSWSHIYNVPLSTAVVDQMQMVAAHIAGRCVLASASQLDIAFTEMAYERQGFLKEDVTVAQPWRALVEGNSAGPTQAGTPVFIAQGTRDEIVHPLVTSLYVNELCAHRRAVDFLELDGVGHDTITQASAREALTWIAGRFAGEAADSDCETAGQFQTPGN